MANLYSADPHFGHANIIKYCNRPFRSISHMDAVIRANYVACVRPDDDFWIVGDFGHGRGTSEEGYLARILDLIPGRKHLVTGNHDDEITLSLPWHSVHDIVSIKDGDQRVVMCHYPMITWNGARKGAIQLFGHVHENWLGTRNSVNVGVDVWGFMPVRMTDILKRAKTLPVNPLLSKVEHNFLD